MAEDVLPNKSRMNDVEVSSEAAITEALMEKIAANISYLLDTLDDIDDDLDFIEGRGVVQGAQNSTANPGSGWNTIASSSITPKTSNVLIVCSGLFWNDSTGKFIDIELRLRRGSTNVYAPLVDFLRFEQHAVMSLGVCNFLDTNATPQASNTYTLQVISSAAGIYYGEWIQAGVHLLEV